jgi:hypothetical protein
VLQELIGVTLTPRAITQTQLVFIVIVLKSVVLVFAVLCQVRACDGNHLFWLHFIQLRHLEVRHFLKLCRVGSVLCLSGNVWNAAVNSLFILL